MANPVANGALDPEYLKSHDDQMKLISETLPDQINQIQQLIKDLKEQRKLLAEEQAALVLEKQTRDLAHGEHHQKMMTGLTQLSKLLEEALASPTN